jgi:hypothetical protein
MLACLFFWERRAAVGVVLLDISSVGETKDNDSTLPHATFHTIALL